MPESLKRAVIVKVRSNHTKYPVVCFEPDLIEYKEPYNKTARYKASFQITSVRNRP